MLLRTSLAVLFGWAPLSLIAAQGQPGQSSGVTALTHVRVIDGTGATPLEDATVVIEGNHILTIQAGAGAVPAGARVLDLHGDTVMPGLINAHGHLALIADGQNSATAYTAENVLAELRQYESYGVTAMLSLAGWTSMAAERSGISLGSLPSIEKDAAKLRSLAEKSPFFPIGSMDWSSP